VDSAPLFGHAVRLWRASGDLPGALAAVVRHAREHSEGRYNLLATDGETLVGTAAGDTLQEREADLSGLRYMVQGGYNPRGMVQTMEILQREHPERGPPRRKSW
jgi:predicted Zn-dependent protease